ncbi:2-phospho-L-lactate guanylyltransferase [Halorubrum terrestre]|uniref:2-phospho-L-lactate guanylyltransferase n=1 Tax=Halorubrum distributum TaxID=29283 RepID=A0A6B1IAJ4_9EURY|nr:2-phospho-L-lactate guanylyltransferase [Halorubrum terrestre]MYL16197.1 2-phospho-L-lactate guanylyltransferase [Halorubrum terrestre]
MEVIVPFSTDRPKSRLSDVLSADERAAFARAMLDDVLDAVAAAGGEPRVLATDAVDVDSPVTVDDRPLTDAVNAVLDARLRADSERGKAVEPVAVVMADLALATPTALDRLFEAGRDADVAVAPGRGGGTNAFVASHPDFRVDYHGASYLDHREIASEIDAAFRTVDSHRLGTDVDEPADLAEVLIHAEGRAAAWLREAGFALDAEEGRVAAVRE